MDSNYKFIKVLGSGSFGTTWLAQDKKSSEKVAIKIFKARDKTKSNIEEFQWEIEMLSALLKECFPHAVCARESYIENGDPRLVMDFVDGENLSDQIFTKWPRKKSTLECDLIRGIRVVHSHGIVHEDIKGANIMWDKKMKMYRYIDFGLSCTKQYSKDGMVNLNRIRFPCGTYGTKYIASPDMELYRQTNKIIPWEILQAHDYWAIGLEILRWHTLNPKLDMYYYVEYMKFCKKNNMDLTKKFIREAHLDSAYPLYWKLDPRFIEYEISKVKNSTSKALLFLLLEQDGHKRFENFQTIE